MTDHERGVEAAKNILLLRAHELSAQELAEAAISAYLATTEPSKPVAEAVKALEWRDGRNAETVFNVVQHATILGAEELVGLEYTILGPDRHGLFEVILGDKIINFGNSEEQAKVVSQLDYQRRIMSALSTPPQAVEKVPDQFELAIREIAKMPYYTLPLDDAKIDSLFKRYNKAVALADAAISGGSYAD